MKIPNPPLIRRLAGMIYDFCVAATLATIVSYIGVLFVDSAGFKIEPGSIGANIFFAIDLLVGLLYFIYYCTQKDHTAGMWVWKLRMINSSTEGKPSYQQISLRYFSLLIIITLGFFIGSKVLGLGIFGSIGTGLLTLAGSFLWALKDGKQRLLHEALSNTQLIDTRIQTK